MYLVNQCARFLLFEPSQMYNTNEILLAIILSYLCTSLNNLISCPSNRSCIQPSWQALITWAENGTFPFLFFSFNGIDITILQKCGKSTNERCSRSTTERFLRTSTPQYSFQGTSDINTQVVKRRARSSSKGGNNTGSCAFKPYTGATNPYE